MTRKRLPANFVVTQAAVLKKLRKLCLALPEATETVTFGHPTFRVADKMFSVWKNTKANWASA